MHITFVKKIKADGMPCRKCAEVEERLEKAGQMPRIDEVVIADERDPGSPGMRLAARYGVEQAPFFIVDDGKGPPRIYTIYLRFVKEVLGGAVNEADEAKEILERNPDLDFI